MAKKVNALFIYAQIDMPQEIKDKYYEAIECRGQNDTCIMWDERFFDEDCEWQNWLIENFDLSDVFEIVIDHSW